MDAVGCLSWNCLVTVSLYRPRVGGFNLRLVNVLVWNVELSSSDALSPSPHLKSPTVQDQIDEVRQKQNDLAKRLRETNMRKAARGTVSGGVFWIQRVWLGAL